MMGNGSGKVAKFGPFVFAKRLLSPYVIIALTAIFLLACFWFMVLSPQQNKRIQLMRLSEAQNRFDNADDDQLKSIEEIQDINSEKIPDPPSATVKPELESDPLKPIPGETLSDKWIVVTSIQPPTEDVKILGGLSRLGWRLLVVGDMSTPPDWPAPEGVRFLGYDEASKLGYNLLTFQRWKTYSIKNIGYLFAIQHGAKYIYDTDDDNHPTDNLKSMLELSGHLANGTRLESIRALVWNPQKGDFTRPALNTLPHFGQSTLWPRGFPLGDVARPPPRTYKICETTPPSWIQGVVNGDPDMDAIFRLTRKHFNTPINLTFDHAPSVVIPQRFFVQSNSQNTFFTHETLALLFFPFSKLIAMRETDIWRSYIGQPLLWLVGARKGYVSPNAFQARNPHDYLKDFSDELNLYKYSGQLIDFLSQWTCPELTVFDFGNCFIKIYEDLAAKNLIATQFDVESARAWISDLRRIGFRFPKRKSTEDCLGGGETVRQVQFYPVEQPIPLPAESQLKRFSSSSSSSQPVVGPQRGVLIAWLSNLTSSFDLAVENLNSIYENLFSRRIFCVNSKVILTPKMTCIEAHSQRDCLDQVASLRLEAKFYAMISISNSNSVSLLTPSGVQRAINQTNTQSELLIHSPCGGKTLLPSVLITTSLAIRDFSMCSSDDSALMTQSKNCTFNSSPVDIVDNCQLLIFKPF